MFTKASFRRRQYFLQGGFRSALYVRLGFNLAARKKLLPSTTPLRNSSLLALDVSELILVLFLDPTRTLGFEFFRIRTLSENAFISTFSTFSTFSAPAGLCAVSTLNHVCPVFAIPAKFPRPRGKNTCKEINTDEKAALRVSNEQYTYGIGEASNRGKERLLTCVTPCILLYFGPSSLGCCHDHIVAVATVHRYLGVPART